VGTNQDAQGDREVSAEHLKNSLQARLKELQEKAQVGDFVLRVEAQPWCQRDRVQRADDSPVVTSILVSFVERPVLGEIFAYEATLLISGRLTLTLPTTTSGEERQRVQQAMHERLSAYVDHLPPEAPLIFADFMAAAVEVHPYARLTLQPGDFQVTRLEGQQVPLPPKHPGMRDKQIDIARFEKAVLEHVAFVPGG
jgi:hypothetical protein